MHEVDAIVRNPVGGLTDPTVLLVLLVATAFALWSRRRVVRVLVVLLLIVVVSYREHMLYIFVRMVQDKRELIGGQSPDFLHGVRLMQRYAAATNSYSVGCAILLGVLSIVGLRQSGTTHRGQRIQEGAASERAASRHVGR